MPLSAGTRLGVYEIVGSLGEGGMGEVYKARDTRLDRTVAIKILNATLSADPAFRARFDAEARTLSQIAHPNICVLHDVGTSGDTAYLVLEYLEGETLADRLLRGRLPFDEARRIGAEICRALETAHRAGVTHRDLKPGNVMLTKSGAKLLDFGLARVQPRAAGADMSTAVALTQAGTLLGTAPYMAPEQLQGLPADARSDIFALGSVLFEMFTGRRAFEGASPMASAAAVLSTEPSAPTTVAPGLPPALDPIVQGCLARDPDARWQSAHDVGRQLETLRVGTTVGANAVRRAGWAWLPWAVALVAIAAAAAAWWTSPARVPVDAVTLAFQVPVADDTVAVASVEGNSMALSPDGTQLAWVAAAANGSRVWLRSLSQLDARPIAGTDGARTLFWSPDNRSIAFFIDGALQRIDLPASAPVTICAVKSGIGYTGSWGAAGQILFAPIQGEAIFRVAASGGSPEGVVVANRAADERRVAWPWFLPDGRSFIYQLHEGATSFLMQAREGQPARRIAELESEAQYADPNYLVFTLNGALVAQRFDSGAGRLTGDRIPLAAHVQSFPASGWGRFSASRTGTVAFGQDVRLAHLAWIDRDGRETGTIGAAADYLDLALSPDGEHVLASRLDASNTYDVWSVDLAHGTEIRMTSGPGTKISPALTPDLRHLIYSRTAGGSPQIYDRDLASGHEERLIAAEGFQSVTSIAHDGHAIVYTQRTDRGDWDLLMLPLEGQRTPRPLAVTAFSEEEGRLSPDDGLLAFTSNETQKSEVYVAPVATPFAKVRVSSNGGSSPRWSPTGRELLYLTPDGRLIRVAISAAPAPRVGTAEPVFPSAHLAWRDYLVLPDNRLLAIANDPNSHPQPMTVIHNALR